MKNLDKEFVERFLLTLYIFSFTLCNIQTGAWKLSITNPLYLLFSNKYSYLDFRENTNIEII